VALVILSVAKNLVLHRDISPFNGTIAPARLEENGIWVLRDEILRYAQKDKGGAWYGVLSTS
jgi:hypothetical protein